MEIPGKMLFFPAEYQRVTPAEVTLFSEISFTKAAMLLPTVGRVMLTRTW